MTCASSAISVGVLGLAHAVIEQPMCTPVGAAITQTQVNGRGFRHNLMELYRQRALYRSLPAALGSSVPKSITHYYFLNFFGEMFVPEGDVRRATALQASAAGVATGVAESFISSPLNFVRSRMQRPEWGYRNTFDCVRTVVRTEGALAFYKGLAPVLLRNPFCNGVTWFTLKSVDNALPEFTGKWMVAGAVGGAVGSFFSYPFEILRTAQMHNMRLDVSMSTRGLRRLYAGWAPGATQLILSSVLMAYLTPNMKVLQEFVQEGCVANTVGAN
eukprot:TRINITY_DN25163_c0_g1_i1.p1 TRINITY_DN25163_c0_g1~~TRINITY_DN25163_c0_g1_i1.p1  ORF type:complete len:273 (+),score=87.29 TRINITY_DN25163_c0_g1_i1:67-885(+)